MEWLALLTVLALYYLAWPRVRARWRRGVVVPEWVRRLPPALGLLLMVLAGIRIVTAQPISGAVLAITGLVLLTAFRR